MIKKIFMTFAFRWYFIKFPITTIRQFHNRYCSGIRNLQRAKIKVPLSYLTSKQFHAGLWEQSCMWSNFKPNSAKRFFSSTMEQLSVTGLPFKGQGLKKKSNALASERMDKFVRNRQRDQEWGKKYIPAFPDILFFVRLIVMTSSGVLLGWIFYPNFADYNSSTDDPTLVFDSANQIKPDNNFMLKVYMNLPLRLLSRTWGQFNRDSTVPVSLRPYLFGLFASLYNVNIDEAINPDLKSYTNFSEFFRRPIKSSVRPINEDVDLVSPADGKILHFGEVISGAIEQIKGMTYSLQKFLGPLHSEPTHDSWGRQDGYEYNWSLVPIKQYAKALMHCPEANQLYHCVVYLAPGDYHRFHSPADWIVKHRRHFPGDLLSVNPYIASLVPNLFILNERVVLSGEWEHGFFSMTAVGATNVGSVEVYGDLTLNTNRPKRVYGGYYDEKYDNVPVKKGMGMGEFNLGSTIVLVFEAPSDFEFCIKQGNKILYGEALRC